MAADNRVKLIKEAEKFMIQGRTTQAISEYLKIVRIYPNDVLTLNTVGDLYLSLGRTSDANDCFLKVAENFVRNNFLLKAIAVYKKILHSDPDNLEINSTIASLLARQGQNTDACNQYLHLAALYEKAGHHDQVIHTYEKIVDLDPANALIQKKLADVFLEKEENKKGLEHLLNAARALFKAGDHVAAMDCYRRTVKMDPLNLNGLKGLMECCLKTGETSIILEQLEESLTQDPDNLDIKEILGETHLAAEDPDSAIDILKTVISSDESRYECMIPVIDTLIDLGKYDQASESLDLIIPILISHRKTELAIQYCEKILQRCDFHIPTMDKLASLHLTTGDVENHLAILDRVADYYVEEKNASAALVYIEKILQANPESQKHLDLHKICFVDAHPDAPYVPPEPPSEARIETGPTQALPKDDGTKEESSESIVEADLLINYGMKEKAIGLLQNMEARNPTDKKVRTRLLTLYKESELHTEAAEQALLLAVLYKKSNDDESVEKYLSKAKQLDSDLYRREHDLDLFAKKKGIITLTASDDEDTMQSDDEVDLSGDLLDIFFTDNNETVSKGGSAIASVPDEIEEEFTEELSSTAPTQSIEEKLQEVDFYIRLGFNDEALNKLNEIAKISPDNPELPSRYEKLQEAESSEKQEEPPDARMEGVENRQESITAEAVSQDDTDIFEDIDVDKTLENIGESPSDSAAHLESADFSSLDLQGETNDFDIKDNIDNQNETGLEDSVSLPESADFSSLDADATGSGATDIPEETTSEDFTADSESKPFIDNSMFSDLLKEVSSLNEQEIEKESFEDHFSLGTAYRDMDLIDEAVKEFQTAIRIAEYAKDSPKLIQCCGMLSMCFIKKSMPRSALRWCQTGLSVHNITQQESMALRYDMGVSHTMEGNPDLALQCFDQIFSIDPGYRDVALKIDDIKNGRKQL